MKASREYKYKDVPCPHGGCPLYGITPSRVDFLQRYGKKQTKLLQCHACGRAFSELKGSPLWDSRLTYEEMGRLLASLALGNGIRATARRHGMSKNTVKRYLRIARVNPELLWPHVWNANPHVTREAYDACLGKRRAQAPGRLTRTATLP